MASPPKRPPAPNLREAKSNPMKKRMLKSWDQGEQVARKPVEKRPAPSAVPSATPSTVPFAVPEHLRPPLRTRRYPKLLLTDAKGNLVANPLRLPSGSAPVMQQMPPLLTMRNNSVTPRQSDAAHQAPRVGMPHNTNASHPELWGTPPPSSNMQSKLVMDADLNASSNGPNGNSLPFTREDAKMEEDEVGTEVECGDSPSALPRMIDKNGKVIQVGKRSGTVQYWRSSLQMPKGSGIQKTRKQPTERKPSPPVVRPAANHRGMANPNATRAPLDTGQRHEFWRNSTKLPSVSSDKARLKRMKAAAVQEIIQAQDEMQTVVGVEQGEKVTRSQEPVSSEPRQTDQSALGQLEDAAAAGLFIAPRIRAENAGALMVGMSTEGGMDEQNEIRRLHLTREYEMHKLEAYAESRYHVKMNLRGRNKLEKWLSTGDAVVENSVLFVVLLLNLDRRMVSHSARERQDALEEMDNEHLRMMEALMARTSTRDGHTNWAVLTANLDVKLSSS